MDESAAKSRVLLIGATGRSGSTLVSRILVAARDADRAISKASSLQLMSALADARSQLEALVPSGFVSATGLERLRHVPRYLEAITLRVQRMQDNPGRDRQWLTEFDQARTAYEKAGGTIPIDPESDPRLVRVRWLLEELRVAEDAAALRIAGRKNQVALADHLPGKISL